MLLVYQKKKHKSNQHKSNAPSKKRKQGKSNVLSDKDKEATVVTKKKCLSDLSKWNAPSDKDKDLTTATKRK